MFQALRLSHTRLCFPLYLLTLSTRTIFVPLNNQQTPPAKTNNHCHTCKKSKEDEITVYIKGFLAKGERPEEFEHWLKCHEELAGSHGWGRLAHGYYWKSGDIWENYIPYGAVVGTAYQLFSRRMLISPQTLAVLGATEALTMGGRVWLEFLKASQEAIEHAPELANHLRDLHGKYGKVRLVAHSLGCDLLLRAMKLLKASDRPHEVHLVAPSLIEQTLEHNLAKELAYLYHCDRDLILTTASLLVLEGQALGKTGPTQKWQGLVPVDVSDKFGFFVHKEYRSIFHRIAIDHKVHYKQQDTSMTGGNSIQQSDGSASF